MDASGTPLVLLAAGGTGGHLFPAEALADALHKRGVTIDLATDHRAAHFKFPARAVHVVPSATVRGRDPISLVRTATLLALGTAKAWSLLRRIRPNVVVGFGGYPTVPPASGGKLARGADGFARAEWRHGARQQIFGASRDRNCHWIPRSQKSQSRNGKAK